jgi:hypothetical protein
MPHFYYYQLHQKQLFQTTFFQDAKPQGTDNIIGGLF